MKQKKLQRKSGEDGDGACSNAEDDNLESDRMDELHDPTNHGHGHISPQPRDVEALQSASSGHQPSAFMKNYLASYTGSDDRTDCENEEIDVVSDEDSFHGNTR